MDSAYATTERPAYEAKAGYLGIDASVELAYRQRIYSLYAYVDYAYYGGATNASSPLFKKTDALTILVGFNWYLWFSNEPAKFE